MTPREITRKRKERLEKERANHIADLERLRKEKKAEYLLKLRERRMEEAKERAERRERGETEAYSYGFKSIPTPELLEERHMYERMKKIALSNGKKELVALCNGRLKKIDEEIKLRG